MSTGVASIVMPAELFPASPGWAWVPTTLHLHELVGAVGELAA